jgi:hypothetical protein
MDPLDTVPPDAKLAPYYTGGLKGREVDKPNLKWIAGIPSPTPSDSEPDSR